MIGQLLINKLILVECEQCIPTVFLTYLHKIFSQSVQSTHSSLVIFQSTLLSTLFRFFRRGSPSSPASGLLPSPQTKPTPPGSKGTPEGQEPFIQLVQAFVRHVQRWCVWCRKPSALIRAQYLIKLIQRSESQCKGNLTTMNQFQWFWLHRPFGAKVHCVTWTAHRAFSI